MTIFITDFYMTILITNGLVVSEKVFFLKSEKKEFALLLGALRLHLYSLHKSIHCLRFTKLTILNNFMLFSLLFAIFARALFDIKYRSLHSST